MDSGFTPSYRGGSGPPLVCLHGFTDTWRTWELVLPELERHHEVLALTLAGHAGGPPAGDPASVDELVDAAERAIDEAGFDTTYIVGNSLGGYVALHLAARGRARTVPTRSSPRKRGDAEPRCTPPCASSTSQPSCSRIRSAARPAATWRFR